MDILQEIPIGELMGSPVGKALSKAMEAVSAIQQKLLFIADGESSGKLELLKIGTVFQVFLVDTLAAGKKPSDLDRNDWKNIADKVSRYAVLEDGRGYSEFVFMLYADYIDISAKSLSKIISKETYTAIKRTAAEIRSKTESLRENGISETTYVEDCLWLSLEAMMKLLSSSLTTLIGEERSNMVQAVSQLSFEYGRCVLYAKEQAVLSAYIENQYELDKMLENKLEECKAEIQKQAERFQCLINESFSVDIQNFLKSSAALARAVGVQEAELLTSVDDVDAFFTD